MAMVLIPWRGQLDTADNALFLVLVIVVVASTGRRLAAAVAAFFSAAAFDFLLTRPYESFRISRHQDLITELLLLLVGLAVGELAARGRSHRIAAADRLDEMSLLHSITELAAAGGDPDLVTGAACAGLERLLSLRSCTFVQGDPELAARITPDGVLVVGGEAWSSVDLGLPVRGVDLPVRSGGWLFGHLMLSPCPGLPIDPHLLLVSVAIADQVGAALAGEQQVTVVSPRRG
jgi:hypothetical protein